MKRARRAPRRILSLLLYAQSVDVFVPNGVIHQLYSSVFDESNRQGLGQRHTTSSSRPRVSRPQAHEAQAQPHGPALEVNHVLHSAPVHKGTIDLQRTYGVAHLRECLAEDIRTNELDIQIEEADNKILLRGEVQHDDRRKAVEKVAHECFPGMTIENQIRVQLISHPSEAEDFP